MKRLIWFAAAGLVIVALAAAGAFLTLTRYASHTFSGQAVEPAASAPDLGLVDESGVAFKLSSLRGEWIFLTYGYTTCPDVCPMTLGMLRQVKQSLGPQAADVRVVFVSVDPARDTPEVLRVYVHHFGDDFKGLTGTPEQVARAAAAYGVRYEIRPSDSAVGYLVSHTADVYLIDPQFRWRVTYPFGVGASEITGDIQYLMAQKSAAQ